MVCSTELDAELLPLDTMSVCGESFSINASETFLLFGRQAVPRVRTVPPKSVPTAVSSSPLSFQNMQTEEHRVSLARTRLWLPWCAAASQRFNLRSNSNLLAPQNAVCRKCHKTPDIQPDATARFYDRFVYRSIMASVVCLPTECQ